jgi:hypothetical protein
MAEGDTAAERYDLGGALPVDVGTLAPGTNLLVSGPAMSGKLDVVYDLLTVGRDDPRLVMTTDDPVLRVRARLDERGVGVDPETTRIVDASGAPEDDDESTGVHRVGSPSDLTGMGVEFTRAVDAMGNPSRLRLGFCSVSTLLRYVDEEQAFSFLHVLSRRGSSAGYLGAYAIDPTTHDEQFVNVVTSIFDGVVDLRESEGERELRVRGLAGVDPAWTAFQR